MNWFLLLLITTATTNVQTNGRGRQEAKESIEYLLCARNFVHIVSSINIIIL